MEEIAVVKEWDRKNKIKQNKKYDKNILCIFNG